MRDKRLGGVLGKLIVLLGLAALSTSAGAQIRIIPEEGLMAFGGGVEPVRVVFENASPEPIEANLNIRLEQATSSTVVPVGKSRAWKKMTILAGQKVIESTPVELPAVRAEARFLVRWLTEGGKVIGAQQVRVYPRTLLKELAAIAGEKPVGVFDPENRLKPVLKSVEVEFADLEDRGLEYFDGSLAVVGPLTSTKRMPSSLAETIVRKAQAGMRIIWIHPSPEPRLEPASRFITQGMGTIAMADAAVCTNLTENPRAQLNLLRLARLLTKPELLTSIEIKP